MIYLDKVLLILS